MVTYARVVSTYLSCVCTRFLYIYVASQCWTLGRFLPLLIGDLVTHDHKHWTCFLYLHDILEICMAPCVSPMTLSFLSELIRIHLDLFRDCYPSIHLTPKLHYMIHLERSVKYIIPTKSHMCNLCRFGGIGACVWRLKMHILKSLRVVEILKMLFCHLPKDIKGFFLTISVMQM